MKAILRESYGPPSVMRIGEVERPKPKDNEVLIRVHAAEVTKADCELRSFRFPVKWFWLPLRLFLGVLKPRNPIIGGYFSGEIVSVGKRVTKHKVGDLVYGSTQMKMGAYAEFLSLPENYTIVPKPKNASFEESAAVPLGALNAFHFMQLAKLNAGEKVLINGAGGSIGLYAIQIAKHRGAFVTAVDKAEKKAVILANGADQFIDYQKDDFTKGSEQYDVIFDMPARKNFSGAIRCLRPNGRYLIGNPRFFDVIRSFLARKTVRVALAGETIEELQAITSMIEKNELRPVVDRIVQPDQIAEAHESVERERRCGSIVLQLKF